MGVGFSFSNDKDCYVTDEKQVGSDLYSAMQEFYKSFPERRSSELYITGESYAGVYCPTLAKARREMMAWRVCGARRV